MKIETIRGIIYDVLIDYLSNSETFEAIDKIVKKIDETNKNVKPPEYDYRDYIPIKLPERSL